MIFLIPINIFAIGDGLAVGLQWIILRYQQSYLGDSIILFYKSIEHIHVGLLTGRSAIAAELSVLASVLVILVLILFLYAAARQSVALIKAGALLTIAGGCIFLVSDMVQYGVLFNGPSGFTIPIGVPCILFAGGWIYTREYPEEREDPEPEHDVSETKPPH